MSVRPLILVSLILTALSYQRKRVSREPSVERDGAQTPDTNEPPRGRRGPALLESARGISSGWVYFFATISALESDVPQLRRGTASEPLSHRKSLYNTIC